jgi:hypothetical protein
MIYHERMWSADDRLYIQSNVKNGDKKNDA